MLITMCSYTRAGVGRRRTIALRKLRNLLSTREKFFVWYCHDDNSNDSDKHNDDTCLSCNSNAIFLLYSSNGLFMPTISSKPKFLRFPLLELLFLFKEEKYLFVNSESCIPKGIFKCIYRNQFGYCFIGRKLMFILFYYYFLNKREEKRIEWQFSKLESINKENTKNKVDLHFEWIVKRVATIWERLLESNLMCYIWFKIK